MVWSLPSVITDTACGLAYWFMVVVPVEIVVVLVVGLDNESKSNSSSIFNSIISAGVLPSVSLSWMCSADSP